MALRSQPNDTDDKELDDRDVDSDENRRWQEWIDDDSGKVEVPLPPRPDQPEIGIHTPTPEEDFDPERDREWREQRKNPDDPDSVPRGIHEWKMRK